MGAENLTYNDSVWTIVNIPHDWRIHDQYNKNNIDKNGYLPRGIGWYRKRLDINSDDSISDIYLDFQGVFRNCTVWINGKKAGSHLSGYTGFVLNITNLIDFHSDNNVMAVLVDDLGNLLKVGKIKKMQK
jgi:beta-galactosidase